MIDLSRREEDRRAWPPSAMVGLLDRLPEEQRLAVWLHYSERMKLSDVADVLAVSEFRANALMRIGLRTLTGHLLRAGIRLSAPGVVWRLGNVRRDGAPARVMERAIQTLLAS